MTTPEEIANRVFDQFDNNKNGTLDAGQVKMMLEETYKGLNLCVTEQTVNDALDFMDTNKDGEISKDEYVNMVKKALAKK